MFGFLKKSDVTRAEADMKDVFSFTLKMLPLYPDSKEILLQIYNYISKEGDFSAEANIALFYRLVVMNILSTCVMMRDTDYKNGREDKTYDVVFLTGFIDRSHYWSKKSVEHFIFEQSTCQLSKDIESKFSLFDVQKRVGSWIDASKNENYRPNIRDITACITSY